MKGQKEDALHLVGVEGQLQKVNLQLTGLDLLHQAGHTFDNEVIPELPKAHERGAVGPNYTTSWANGSSE